MNNRKVFAFTTLAIAMTFSLVGCGGDGGNEQPTKKYDFQITQESGRGGVLYMNETDRIIVTEENPEAGKNYNYTYSIGGVGSDYLSVSKDPTELAYILTPLQVTAGDSKVTVSIKETTTNKTKMLAFKIENKIDPQNSGKNYSGDEEKRTEALGKLEEYAMDKSLTGITLFEEGAYVRYSNRVQLPTNEYITGYGFGLLTEGKLNGRLSNPAEPAYPDYLQSSTSSDPLTINAWDATGSQVSDLNSYISTSYWGTKMDGTTSYTWYPVLARDTVNGKANNRPIPLNEDGSEITVTDPKDAFTRWRVYVKTGTEETPLSERVFYRTASSANAEFNNRPVKLEDYEFVYQMLLTEQSQQSRGTELAGDTSYGIKGGAAFFRKTKNKTNEADVDTTWKLMQESGELGIHTGVNANGSYIDIELLSPVNQFYGMYYLSSNLYSPIPREFMKKIGKTTGGAGDNATYMDGAHIYGSFANGSSIIDNCLCAGPFYLEKWVKTQETIFSRNNDWFEYEEGGSRYQIPGIAITVLSEATQRDDAIYDHFMNGEFDSTAIPQSKIKTGEKLPTDKKNVGDSTFKLNVNSCTQDRWNELFGKNGSISTGPDNAYLVKPWMSNDNFLKGIFWSINRQAFADARGVIPSINYFADAYMSVSADGTGESYNKTQAHKDAIANFHDTPGGVDNFGFDLTKSRSYFKLAVQQLAESGDIQLGTKSNPTTISIHIRWMYQTDIRDYGDEIGNYFTNAFNDDSVCGGAVKLEVKQEAVAQWDQVYNDYLMTGKFDFGFGAISGNTLNPLNFMEVLKSDNSSGFTLNWGNDTGVVDPLKPIIFDGKAWSYDALWEAADHGAVVKNGASVNPVDHGYVQLQSGAINDLWRGGESATVEIPFSFLEIETGVDLEIKSIELYFLLAGNIKLVEGETCHVDEEKKMIYVYISEANGAEWNQLLVDACDLEKEAEKGQKTEEEKWALLHPFTRQNYNIYWNVEVHYTLSIDGGYPADNVYYISANKSEDDQLRKGLALAK